jgi:hypothetical protein
MIIISIIIILVCLAVLKYILTICEVQKLFVRSVELIIAFIVCFFISQVFDELIFLLFKKDMQKYSWIIHIFLFVWFYFNSKEFNKKHRENYE